MQNLKGITYPTAAKCEEIAIFWDLKYKPWGL